MIRPTIRPRPLLAALAALSLVAAPEAPAQTADEAIRVHPPVVDFGDVAPGERVTRTVRLQNTSFKNFRIFRVRTTCECTEASVSATDLGSRSFVELTAVFEAGQEMGPRDQSLIVGFVDERAPLRIPVRANVNRGVRFSAEPARAAPGERRVVTLESADGAPFRVLAISGRAPRGDRSEPRHLLEEPRDAGPASPSARFTVVETDHPSAPVIAIRRSDAAGGGARPWVVRHDHFVLGHVHPGETRTVDLELGGLGRDPLATLSDVRVDSVGADVRVIGIAGTRNGLDVRLRVRIDDDARGLVRARVELTSEGHTEPVELFARAPEDPGHASGSQ